MAANARNASHSSPSRDSRGRGGGLFTPDGRGQPAIRRDICSENSGQPAFDAPSGALNPAGAEGIIGSQVQSTLNDEGWHSLSVRPTNHMRPVDS
jgi:hypothetical protein